MKTDIEKLEKAVNILRRLRVNNLGADCIEIKQNILKARDLMTDTIILLRSEKNRK